MKINRTIVIASIVAVGTLALSASPAFAATGTTNPIGNPWSLVTAVPGFALSSKSTITFAVRRGALPRDDAYYVAPEHATTRLAERVGHIVWAGGPAAKLRSGIVWQVGVGPRVMKGGIHNHPTQKPPTSNPIGGKGCMSATCPPGGNY